MGSTFARVKVWVSGEILTASDLNGEIDNILDNLTPAGVDDASADLTAMRSVVDPYPGGTESLATSSEGELERLRYVQSQNNKTSQWYIFPDLKSIDDTDSPYTASVDDRVILADCTNGAITINLPAVSGVKDSKDYIIKKIDSTANAVTVDGNASETIDGSTTYALSNQYDSLHIIADGTNWAISSSSSGQFSQETFTANGTFTVPAGVTSVLVSGSAGGGGAGSGGVGGFGSGGGGGGGGRTALDYPVSGLTPGASVTVTIGAGGAGGAAVGSSPASGNGGSAGSNTSFGAHLVLAGGNAGAGGVNSGPGGNGGSARGGSGAGGKGGTGGSGTGDTGAAGGNSGAYGEGGAGGGVAGNVGGGGGGGAGFAGDGGAGGTANDGGASAAGTAAAANTGGGGGASGGGSTASGAGGAGGSGVLIVKW